MATIFRTLAERNGWTFHAMGDMTLLQLKAALRPKDGKLQAASLQEARRLASEMR